MKNFPLNIFSKFFLIFLLSCENNSMSEYMFKDWEKRDQNLQSLRNNLNQLAKRMAEIIEPGTCEKDSECAIQGYGVKICDDWDRFYAYSLKDVNAKQLEPLRAEFNEKAKILHNQELAMTSCGESKPLARCIDNRCVKRSKENL